jgi:hypothetical protein
MGRHGCSEPTLLEIVKNAIYEMIALSGGLAID